MNTPDTASLAAWLDFVEYQIPRTLRDELDRLVETAESAIADGRGDDLAAIAEDINAVWSRCVARGVPLSGYVVEGQCYEHQYDIPAALRDDEVAVETAQALLPPAVFVAGNATRWAIYARWSELLATFENAGLGRVTPSADGDVIYICFESAHWPDPTWTVTDYRDDEGRWCPGWIEVSHSGESIAALRDLKAQLAGLAEEAREREAREAKIKAEREAKWEAARKADLTKRMAEADARSAARERANEAHKAEFAARLAREEEAEKRLAETNPAAYHELVSTREARRQMRQIMGDPREIMWVEGP
jgi:hypothetical protein